MIELTATFDTEKFRFANDDGDVIIGSATLANGSAEKTGSNRIAVKGKAERGELQRHLSYRFYGRWVDYKNKRNGKTEKQFAFQTFVESQPHGRAGVITYLRKAGEGHGIGQARATKIWERFGGDAVRLLRESPEVIVAAIKGLKIESAEAASEWLKDRQALEDCTIEVSSLLDGRGFPKTTASHAIRAWGNTAADRIKHDPYQLMAFRGCGFKRCDNLYLELGLDPARLRRQAFCAWYAVASNTEGHTWYPAQFAADGVASMVGGTEAKPAAAIKMARRICRLSKDTHGALAIARESDGAIVDAGGRVLVAEGRKAWCEEKVAEIVADRMDLDLRAWPDEASIEDISDHQREQLGFAMDDGPIAILGGSPGTGKTFTAARLISKLVDRLGIDNVAVACPTGKAAVRITESMQDYGLGLKARTWHSLLGVGEADAESGNWGFEHHEQNPWPYKLIVGDESSMIDTNLMSSILRALPKDCCLLLTGDVNQLPPVGHGAPLRDLIAAGLPYGELREIKRNSGGIVEACAAIRDGQVWEPGDNLSLVEELDQVAAMNGNLLAAKNNGYDPVWDCQVLVAVNEKSKLSRKVLNKVLQAEWNQSPAIKGTPFRVGDKVVCLKNSDFPLLKTESGKAESDAKTRVANGELGKVIEIADKFLTIEVDTPYRLIRVPRGKGSGDDTGCSWDIGYALSTHKSQGSEWPVVIVMIDDYPGAKMVCSREWAYTAISRAKDRCVLIGKKSTADAMCRRVAIGKRKTFLRERILKNRAAIEMAGL